ncbi:MAG: (Fe-S)-binding protein [Desulfovibrionaceae bacterium]|jgi:heterodisulfide reductase subunit D
MSQPAFSLKQRLEMEACASCRLCVDVCPAVAATKDGSLSALLRMKGLKEILKSRKGLFRKIFGTKEPSAEQLKEFGTSVFRCSLCGNCQEVCPLGLHLKDLWLSLREELVRTGNFPSKIEMIRDNLESSHNVFDEDNDERADWVEDMRNPPDDAFQKDKAEVVFFTGCVGAYFPLAQKIPIALAEIFEASGVDFTLLGKEEWCCGFPLVGAGLGEGLQTFIDHNLEAVRSKGAKKVVFTCPSCYQIWREAYPKEFELFHASEFLIDLVTSGKVPLKEVDMTVTYHDPCDLGRGARVFDAPREVLRAIPGLKLVEMPHNRENCLCCGGGGNLEMIDGDLSSAMAKRKVEEAVSTGAQAIITTCQQCVRTMTTYAKRNKVAIDVMDLSQLVRQALAL